MKFWDLHVQNLNHTMKAPDFNHSDFQLALNFYYAFCSYEFFREAAKKLLGSI
jgi:hypothetical protein